MFQGRSRFPQWFAATVSLCISSTASAEWSSNPAVNLAIANQTGDQVQPKVRLAPDGGCYISWFDNHAGGYDVYLQRLDARGRELWVHNGVLVADRSFSSTQDYGLAVDADGNALISYRDDRAGGIQVGVNKVSPAGDLLWGANGVVLTNTAEFIGSPKVAALADGTCVVAWTQGSILRRQKLNAAGAPQWTAGGLGDAPPPTNSDLIADVVASDAGNVIISWSRNPARHLYAQKYDANGSPLWNGGNPVAVFDGGALQFGYFPPFSSDSAGGAVFSWYDTGGTRNAYVQRVSAAGTELFAHNGVPVSTQTAGRIRLSPSHAFDPATGDTFVFWTESTSPTQNMWGVLGQKITAAGLRAWGDSARTYIPLSSNQNSFVRTVLSGAGATMACFDRSGPALVVGVRVDANGDRIWPAVGVAQLCSVLSGKARLDAASNSAGRALLVWGDARTDGGDIYAQNVNPDGSLGNIPADVTSDGSVDFDDVLAILFAWGDCPPKDGFHQPCPADIAPPPDGDGTVNFDDVLEVLFNWG